MVIPLSIYPDNRKGVLAALHYSNWQVISAAENIQTSNSKPSMWLIHKRQEDPAYCHALVRRWFWSFGDTIAEVTNGCTGMSRGQLESMCILMDFAISNWTGLLAWAKFLSPEKLDAFKAHHKHERHSGHARMRRS
ncbi:hypothetical protein ABBQ38_004345 [Trebouxia sp. C0009 RCD-2024]